MQLGPRISTAIKVVTLLWLFTHFAFTVIYVTPSNPLKSRLDPLLRLSIGTFFSQSWSLFAPNPYRENISLIVRPLSEAEASQVTAEICTLAGCALSLPEDGWLDITAPLLTRAQSNRFSAYERLARPQLNSILVYLSGGQSLAPWYEMCRDGDAEACTLLERKVTAARKHAGPFLARIASAMCNDSPQGCGSASMIVLRARTTAPVPWSRRGQDQLGHTQDLDIGIYPLDTTVVGSGLYILPDRS